jgi:hypothetical protein
LQRLPDGVFRDIHHNLYARYVESPRSSENVPVLAVDGTKVKLPPSLISHGFRKQQGASRNPLALLTVLYDVRAGVIAGYDISADFDERGALLRLVHRGTLPQGSVLLGDRGFYSALVWRALSRVGVRAIFRVRRNADRAVKEFAEAGRRRAFTRVGHVPTDFVRWHGTGDGKEEASVAEVCDASRRPVGHPRPGRDGVRRGEYSEPVARAATEDEWLLATTVDSVTAAGLVRAYGARWSIEVAFKVLKSGLGLRGLASRSAVAVRRSIEALCLFSLVVALERGLAPTVPGSLPHRIIPGCDRKAVPYEVALGARAVLAGVTTLATASYLGDLATAGGRRAVMCALRDAGRAFVHSMRILTRLSADVLARDHAAACWDVGRVAAGGGATQPALAVVAVDLLLTARRAAGAVGPG